MGFCFLKAAMTSSEFHPIFEIVTTTAGVVSIKNKVVNEIMHNPVGPWDEANALYVFQSHLSERLTAKSQEELPHEFVLFDVGLGAAANALAAIHCALQISIQHRRPLRLISYEKDLELLEFALKHHEQFSHFQGFQNQIRKLLDLKICKIENITWELRQGDFRELILLESCKPHLIFFDPYSPKVNQEMWTTSCFSELRKKCRNQAEGGALLLTYSQATRIRVALLAAGFFVGYGAATGLKEETTQAATIESLLEKPIGLRWYQRWQRSHERYPFDCAEQERSLIDKMVSIYFEDKV